MNDARPLVKSISAATARTIRSDVLRPGMSPDALVYPGDDHPQGLHAGSFAGDDLVGIATVYPEAPPEALRGEIPLDAYAPGASYRLRGMATLPEVRGAGHGRALLEQCFEHLRNQGARYLWCNARLMAVPFYQRLRLISVGPEFEIEGIGPHYVMWREVA
jgi:GNAT superfamily N-acetyltransferase